MGLWSVRARGKNIFMTKPCIWHNGSFVSSEGHLLAHALHYGSGVFEGIRCYDTPHGPMIFRLHEHMERMAQGAHVLGLRFNVEATTKACVEVIRTSGFREAYLRPIAFFGTGGLTLDVDHSQVDVAVAALAWSSHLGERAASQGISARVSPWRRNAHDTIPPLKLTGAYVNSIIAKREAKQAGFDEALFVDAQGFVCEATGENVFAVFGKEVVAVEHPDALPGITRASVVELSSATSKRLALADLLSADEVFVTGTSAEVTPVRQIDTKTFDVGPVTRELQQLYRSCVKGTERSRAAWLTLCS